MSTQINDSNGMNGVSPTANLPRKQSVKPSTSLTICSTCFQTKGKGKRHPCGTPAVARENVIKMVENLPEKQQEQVITSLLKHKSDTANFPVDSIANIRPELHLSTEGSKMRIDINPKKPKLETTFSTESLDSFQVNTASTYNEMKKLTNFLRCNVGRKSVPPFYEKHLSENSNALENIYKEGIDEFDTKNGKEKMPVVWADAEELLEAVIEKRNLVGYVDVKLMADGGQGFF